MFRSAKKLKIERFSAMIRNVMKLLQDLDRAKKLRLKFDVANDY